MGSDPIRAGLAPARAKRRSASRHAENGLPARRCDRSADQAFVQSERSQSRMVEPLHGVGSRPHGWALTPSVRARPRWCRRSRGRPLRLVRRQVERPADDRLGVDAEVRVETRTSPGTAEVVHAEGRDRSVAHGQKASARGWPSRTATIGARAPALGEELVEDCVVSRQEALPCLQRAEDEIGGGEADHVDELRRESSQPPTSSPPQGSRST